MSIKPRMTEAAGRKYMALAGLLVIAGALLCVRPAMAQDVKSYTRATFDQWLAKYKDAKPDFKVGDVLTAKDIERMRPFIFPGLRRAVQLPRVQGDDCRARGPHSAQGLHGLHGEVPEPGQPAARPHDGQLRLRTALPEFRDHRRATRTPDGRRRGTTNTAGRISACSRFRRPPGIVLAARTTFRSGKILPTDWLSNAGLANLNYYGCRRETR